MENNNDNRNDQLNNGRQEQQDGQSNYQMGGQPPYGMPNNQMPYGQPQNQFYGQMYNNGNGFQQPDEGIGFSIASMILGILAILLACCFYPLAFLLAVLGLIFGGVGLKKGVGKGMAVTGIILSIISVALAVLVIAYAFSFVSLFK